MTRLAIAKPGTPRVAPLGNLVKADAYRVIVDVDRTLAHAETQAHDAYEAARASGRGAGEAEGRRAAAALMAQTVAAVESYGRRAETRLASIVTEAVRRIVGEFDERELVLRVVRQLLSEARGETGVRLHVSPRQLPAVRDAARGLAAEYPGIEVVADAEVADDACRMETSVGFTTASIAEQLEALGSALDQQRAGQDP